MALYNYFVTAPYAVLAIQMVMLFIYDGLGKIGMITKIKAACLATSIFFLVLSPSAFAEMRSIGGDKVNLRAGPGEKYSVKWVYDNGFPVKIISQKGKWVKV